MNWKNVEARWDQVRGHLRDRWGKLTNDDMEQIRGKRDRLVGKLKERYGEQRDILEQKVDDLIAKL